jgi:hypothetical protein
MSTPEPGWYVNPSGPGRRFWDGDRWTEHIDDTPAAPYSSPPASAGPPPPAPPGPWGGYVPPPPGYGQPGPYMQQSGASGLAIAGYIFAVFMPLVGLILGMVCATRNNEPQSSRHGLGVIVLSIAAMVIWFAILSQSKYYRY